MMMEDYGAVLTRRDPTVAERRSGGMDVRIDADPARSSLGIRASAVRCGAPTKAPWLKSQRTDSRSRSSGIAAAIYHRQRTGPRR